MCQDKLFGFFIVSVKHNNAGVVVRPWNSAGQQSEVKHFRFPEMFSVFGRELARHPFFNFFWRDTFGLVDLPFQARLLAVHGDQIELHAIDSCDYICSLMSCLFIEGNHLGNTIIHMNCFLRLTFDVSRVN